MRKKNFILGCFFSVIVLSIFFTGCGKASSGTSSDMLIVYTSVYPVYDFSKQIGGDLVNVVNLMPAGAEPHDWEPGVSDIKRLEEAEIFVYCGSGMEHWVEDILKTLQNQTLIVVEASRGIDSLSDTEDHDHDHSHDSTSSEKHSDPHVWLNPQYAKKQAENIRDGLAKADPENRDYYESNFISFSEKIDKLDVDFSEGLKDITIKDLVVTHESFGYLCDAYNLRQIGIEGLLSDSEPSPARMAKIIDFIRENQISAIFAEESVSSKAAQAIASETGATIFSLDSIERQKTEQKQDDYFSIMYKNLDTLKKALG